MKKFRYVEIKNRPDGVEAKYKIGDLVQMMSYGDHHNYSWVSSGSIGLIIDIKFFIQETYDATEYIKYVTEYEISWIDKNNTTFLDESMITKLEKI